MIVKELSFVDSVAYLETLSASQFSTKPSQFSVLASNHSRDAHTPNTLVPIGDILKNLVIPGPLPSSPLPKQIEPQTITTLEKRVSALEGLVKSLTEKIALMELR